MGSKWKRKQRSRLFINKIKSLENKIKEYQGNQDLILQDKKKVVKLYQGVDWQWWTNNRAINNIVIHKNTT